MANLYNFTDRVRKSLALAREEAARLGHEYVGSEHILLGLMREGGGVASSALAELDIKPETVRQRVEEAVKKGTAPRKDNPELPYTSRAKKVLELAMTEARDLGHGYVGSEHLLLGILREETGTGATVLVALGVTLERAREVIRRVLANSQPAKAAGAPAEDPGPGAAAPIPTPGGGAPLLLMVSAILAWLVGLLLIFVPRDFEAPMGLVMDDKLATIAQAQGAILLGLGFINWLARRVTDRQALWAILYGNFVVQLVSFAVVLRALVHGFIPPAGAGALVMHVLLGAAFAWRGLKVRRGT